MTVLVPRVTTACGCIRVPFRVRAAMNRRTFVRAAARQWIDDDREEA
jgi:hypothetical protein